MYNITSRNELIEFFNKFTSQCRGKLVSRTPVKLNKRDTATKTRANPFDVVFKVQTIEVDLGADYQAKVNDARLLEGMSQTFEARQRQWGEHVNKVIVEHDEGQFYVNVIEVAKVGEPVYELADGTKVDYSAFAEFLPPYRSSSRQGLDDEVKVRSFKIENVIGLNIDNKVRYVAC